MKQFKFSAGNVFLFDLREHIVVNESILSETEKKHAFLIQNGGFYLKTRYLVRYTLAEFLNTSKSLIIEKKSAGKPYLPDYPEIDFNLSHSGDFLLLGIGKNCQLGVDIETIKPRENMSGLVNRCFSKNEIQSWLALSDLEKQRYFYQIWTRKEAFVKATGEGISSGLTQIEVAKNLNVFVHVPKKERPAFNWHIMELQVNSAYLATLVFK